MSVGEMISFGVLFLAIITALVKIWYSHDNRIMRLENRADVCAEKHSNHEKLQLKQAEINNKVDEHHVEIMRTLATIEAQIANLIDKFKGNEKSNQKN
jgi:cell division protein FtsL